MAEYEKDSIGGLVRSVLEDTRELIREEIALARAEIREEMSKAKASGASFGAAALAGLIGVTLLCIAIGGAIAYLLNWPSWTGFGIVAVLLLVGSYVAARYGQRQLANIRALPETTATVKENLEWIQSKSGQK